MGTLSAFAELDSKWPQQLDESYTLESQGRVGSRPRGSVAELLIPAGRVSGTVNESEDAVSVVVIQLIIKSVCQAGGRGFIEPANECQVPLESHLCERLATSFALPHTNWLNIFLKPLLLCCSADLTGMFNPPGQKRSDHGWDEQTS
jgi:hypothetical protein